MTKFIFYLISVYQKTLSPDHSGSYPDYYFYRCRFYPSCSEYANLAIRQYGLFKGFMFSLFRILRCNPLAKGGYDPPEKVETRSARSKNKFK